MRESWTDERLDDFRAETARRLDRIDDRLDGLAQAVETLSVRMTQFGVGAIITLVLGFLAVILGQ